MTKQGQLHPRWHGLTREELWANQKGRLFRGIIDAHGEGGYRAVVVENFTSRSGVSRRTFYDNFTNGEDAFVQAAEDSVATIVDEIKGDDDPLLKLLCTIINDPYMFLICARCDEAGEEGMAVQARFIKSLTKILRNHQSITDEVVVRGLVSLLAARAMGGQRRLASLRPRLQWVVER